MAKTETFGRPALLDVQERSNNKANLLVAKALLRAAPLLQRMPVITSAGLSLPYTRRNVTRVGQVRQINRDYAVKFAGESTDHTAHLAIMGDAFEIDRVLGAVDAAFVDEQVRAMAPAVQTRFLDEMINGDRAANDATFDGLNKIATDAGRVQSGLNLTVADTGNNLSLRRNMQRIITEVQRMRASGLDPIVIANTDALAALSIGGGIFNTTDIAADAFGVSNITTLSGAPLFDAGMSNSYGTPTTDSLGRTVYPIETSPIIPTVGGTTTDLYVVGLSRINGVAMVTLDGFGGRDPVQFVTPTNAPGVQRRYEVEAPLGIAALDDSAVTLFADVVIA